MRLGWDVPRQRRARGAGSGPSRIWRLTWLAVSPAENWTALLSTGLGSGGKRRRQALGRGCW